jgi:hypothetical protein
MSNSTCAQCGTVIAIGTNFCRQCGQPTTTFRPNAFSEATTRTLDSPFGAVTPTQPANAQITGAAYLPPDATNSTSTTSSETKRLSKTGQSRLIWSLSSLIVILLVALIGLLALWFGASRTSSRPQTAMTIVESSHPQDATPAPPFSPGAPKTIVIPPFAPPDVSITNQGKVRVRPTLPSNSLNDAQSIEQGLIYPGAQVLLNLNHGEKGSVMQLRTNEPAGKVIDWYIAKLKPVKIVRPNNEAAVLESTQIKAVITAEDGGVNILLKRDSE